MRSLLGALVLAAEEGEDRTLPELKASWVAPYLVLSWRKRMVPLDSRRHPLTEDLED